MCRGQADTRLHMVTLTRTQETLLTRYAHHGHHITWSLSSQVDTVTSEL